MHAYTDGSVNEATRNGGGGIYSKPFQLEKFSTNFKTEEDARKAAAKLLLEKKKARHPKVVFSDALSVLLALPNPENKEMATLV